MNSKLVKIIGVIAMLVLVMGFVSACSSAQPASTSEAAGEVPKPSNPGGPGEAVSLTGDAKQGEVIFSQYCTVCHGDQGKGGVANPGTDDTTVPPLNPIDPGLVSSDTKTFATNIDLFIEHGSTPEGDNPAKKMIAWGDTKALTPQQIADVIAYVISLNK